MAYLLRSGTTRVEGEGAGTDPAQTGIGREGTDRAGTPPGCQDNVSHTYYDRE